MARSALAAAPDPDPDRLLTLVRHAKSGDKDTGVADFERPLAPRGARDAPEMARRMARWSDRPSLIVASPARRAAQTAQAFVGVWSPPPHLEWQRGLYLASAEGLLELVRVLPSEHRHAMLVGHNPGLTEFANRFADAGLSNLPTCGTLRVRLWVPQWSDAGWRCASVEQLDTPKSPAR